MRSSDPPGWDAQGSPDTGIAELARVAVENLFEFSPDAVFVTDEEGAILNANPRASELFGYARNEFAEMNIEDLIPERFRRGHPAHRENYNAHPRTRQMGADLNLYGLRRDGSEFPVDIMLKPMHALGGVVTLSFVRDATEQRAAVENERHRDLQLRSIVESVRDYAIYLLDRDGTIVTWNAGGERIKGYSPEEIVGRHFSRFFTQEDRKRGRPQELLRMAAEQGHLEQEGWRLRKDGSRFWAEVVLTAIRDADGELIGFAKLTRDQTDRRRAEESVMLQLTSALLANLDVRKLLDAISASIAEVIPHDSATLGLFDAATGGLIVHFLAPDESGVPRSEVHLSLEGSPAGEVFRTGKRLILDRIQGSNFAPEGIAHHTSIGMQSGIWVPLIHRGEAVGAIAVASRKEAAFTEHDAEMLAGIAGHVAMAVNNAVAFRQISDLRERLSQEKQYLEEEINLENRFEDIVGESTGLRQVLRDIETVAPTDATVLIEGETGTGKELLARAIHRLSPRRDPTFVKLNCAAIPAGLLESELFGHEKGAFTGAIARKLGRLELADGGTLFLDEIGEMPLELQPKLLRALQEREFERLGGTRPIQVNVRLVAATNRELGKLVAERQFRPDLYYRLKVFPIFSPPLRERAGDIPVLARHFVATHARRMGKNIQSIPDHAMEVLKRWTWPGNVRELQNLLERAVILTRGPVLYVPLAELKALEEEEQDAAHHSEAGAPENPSLRAAEREHILRVLRESKGQIGGAQGAALRLGLKRTTLNSKLKKLGIERREFSV